MDLWCVHAKSSGSLLRNSFLERPIIWNLRTNSLALGIRVSRKESLSDCSSYRSVFVKAAGKKNPGNFNSPSSDSGNNDNSKTGEDAQEGKNPTESNKSSDNGSQKSHVKTLDWREFRALLYIQEQAEKLDSSPNQERAAPGSVSLPLKWAHPLSAPENGCLLVATEKLDGVRTFERTVVLLLRAGTRNPQEGPFGIVINRPLQKKMKHMNPTNIDLATTFAECPLNFGGPLDASMFLVRDTETALRPGFEEVINGLYFGYRNSLSEASGLVKKGTYRPQDFRFFVGYAGWQLDQLKEEIESDYWYAVACSPNMLFASSQSSSDGLWQEILQLMGGQYSELSRKPKLDN